MLLSMEAGATSKQALHAADHETWVSSCSNHSMGLSAASCAICKDSAVVSADDMSNHWGNGGSINSAVGTVIAKCQVKCILFLLQNSHESAVYFSCILPGPASRYEEPKVTVGDTPKLWTSQAVTGPYAIKSDQA